MGLLEMVLIDFEPHAVAARLGGGHGGCSGAEEWVQNGVSDEAEHADQALREFDRVRRRMMARGSAREAGPDLLKPQLMLLAGYDAQHAGGGGGSAVATGLSLHQDELDVILDHRVWLVWLAQKAGAVFHLMDGVRNLLPDDRRQVIEAELAAMLLDRRVQWNHCVPALVLSPGKTDIADHADQAAARDQYSEAVAPDLVQLREELFVVLDMAHLSVRVAILLQRPVGWRRNHQVDALRTNSADVAGVAKVKSVRGGYPANGLFDQPGECFVLRDAGDVRLQVIEREHLRRKEARKVLLCGDLPGVSATGSRDVQS